jgi:hypothetical protein
VFDALPCRFVSSGADMTSNTIKALKAYSKDLKDFDFPALQAHIKDESDRAAVIVLAAMLEDKLEVALRKRIAANVGEAATDKLFAYNGPMGTFSARIEIARAFGVIERETCNQLHTLRAMRNACAHSQKPISFAVKELGDALNLFVTGNDSFHSDLTKRRDAPEGRSALTWEVVMLGGAIRRGTRASAIAKFDKLIEQEDANREAKSRMDKD